MYKNLEEFTKHYYPHKREMDRYALQRFIKYHCDTRSAGRLSNALLRADINSIEDFVNADIDKLRKCDCIGEKGLEILMKAKMYIKHSVEEL